ncbi:chloride channel protein [Rhizobacter sp. Root1221]|uniref:chloride channel protein n=1 Tax=Rhizobacter sp. Root1221 TaxID=1736433 RepID=UPI0006FCDE27|nr:chloride channel protein [Rhizobacter sp. Root1221]KQW03089.1 chloride channel protein [Rhizobacter sp. Root1221]
MALSPHPARDYAAQPRLLLIAALAVPIGALGTVAALVLLTLIRFFTNLFFFQTVSIADQSPAGHTLGAWVIALPVIGGVIVGLMARFGTEKIRGHGIPEAIEAILFGKSRMSPKVALLKPLSSGIVIGSGGPFGAEGPIIMTGGAIGSLLGQRFHLSASERKTLLVAGATAGMTGVFGTPLAAVLLGVELLLFELRPRSLLPVAIACAVAGFMRPLLLEAGRLFPLETAPAGWPALASCVVAGVLAGLLSAGMSRALYAVEDLFHRLPLHWMWWPALGGLAVGLGGWWQPRAFGVGYDVIADLLNHRLLVGAALSLLAVKAAMWVVALGSGTSGGVLAPLLMIGAGLGLVLSPVLPGGDAALWPLVCMAAVLAGVLGAPLTATAFAFGLTGAGNALLPLLLACAVSHGVSVLLMRRSIMTERIARRGRHVYREYGVDPQERVHVGDVMTRTPQTVPAYTALAEVAERWFGAGQVHRAFPVVTGDGRFVGMLDRDRLARGDAAALTAGDLFDGDDADVAIADDTCRKAAQVMATTGLERLAVVDHPGTRRLVGLVSRSDLVKPAQSVHEEDAVRER